MEDIVQLITSNGIAVVVVAVYLYKDLKFNTQITELMQKTNEMLAKVATFLDIATKSTKEEKEE